MKVRIVLLSVSLLTTGCTVGPRYKRPTVAVPGSYRGEAPDQDHRQPQNTAPQIVPLGDEKWWDIFQDEQLRKLIRIALNQNYDCV
jgi:multidrug efflux system outer membrane protein